MRLIYIIGLLTVIGTGALWCGWDGIGEEITDIGHYSG